MKIAAFLFSCFLTTAAFAQVNIVAVSNTNQPTPGDYAGVTPQQTVAASFTTTSGTTNPFTVTVRLNGGYAYSGMGGPSVLGPFQLEIYSDAGGSPGSSLAVLSGTNYPTAAGIYVYADTTGLALATNTTYWIVASTPGSSGQAGYEWMMTPVSGTDAGAIWAMGASEWNSGGGWGSLEHLFFAVTISVPLPTISISRPVMLTYPTLQAPLVLQENSSLTDTNWNTVTNAISSSTTNNQTTVILPADAGQMFYRLIPQ